MGTIAREASAPIADGETASGAELELEFDKIFTVINGNIENANIKAAAGIVGTKLANNTIAAAQITGSTITTAELAVAAVAKADVKTDATVEAMTTSTSYVDVPSISSITVTPGSTSDIIWIDFVCHVYQTGASGAAGWVYALSVDGVDTAGLAVSRTNSQNAQATVTLSYAVAAGGTSAQVIKPRYKTHLTGVTSSFGVAGGAGTEIVKILRVQVIPIK